MTKINSIIIIIVNKKNLNAYKIVIYILTFTKMWSRVLLISSTILTYTHI